MRCPRCLAALLLAALSMLLLLSGCNTDTTASESVAEPVSPMELTYATQFSVDKYANGCRLVTIANDRYLVVPEGITPPGDLDENIVLLQQPLDNIYLVATSAMDLFRALDSLDCVRLSGTDADGWYIPEAKQAIENGKMLYAGKYNAPDYERILSEGCNLAVESTMIYHTPEIKEQLERLGIPVLVERSSYEAHPLGRIEWIKLYGVLLGREDEAEQIFSQATAALEPILKQPSTDKTVAFFYINSTGTVNVHKSGDYISEMIRMAGGIYALQDLTDTGNALSTMNMDMESFYAAAKDADVLIYNSTIDGELKDLEQLLEKSELLTDFKAVQNGDVWCTGQNMFQESMALGQMILEIHTILTENEPGDLEYLYRLQ